MCLKRSHLLVGVGHVLVSCDDGLEAQINTLHFTDGIHGRHHQLQERMRSSLRWKTKKRIKRLRKRSREKKGGEGTRVCRRVTWSRWRSLISSCSCCSVCWNSVHMMGSSSGWEESREEQSNCSLVYARRYTRNRGTPHWKKKTCGPEFWIGNKLLVIFLQLPQLQL